jgi:outer membrane cobalamin receptor
VWGKDLPNQSPPLGDTFEFLQEEQSLQPFELGEIVSSTDQPLGSSTSEFILTDQDVLDQNARSMGDALRFVPSLFLSVWATTGQTFASIRGLTARQNVVFIDGRPVYDPWFGDMRFENLPIDNIAKIKVIKGPVDAAYGPNNLGTVINIVTKRGTAKPTTRATVSYESHNTQDYWLEHGGRKEKLNYYMTGSFRKTGGFSLANDFEGTVVQPGESREQSSHEKKNVSGNLGYDFGPDDRIAVLAGYYKAELDTPPNINAEAFPRFGIPFNRFVDWSRWYVDLYGQTKIGDRLSLRGNAYFDRFHNSLDTFTDSSYQTKRGNSKFTNKVWGFNGQVKYTVTDQLKVKGGVFLKQDQHKERDDNSKEEHDALTTGYFLDAEWAPLPMISFSAGLNYDVLYINQDRNISAVSPRGAIILQPLPSTRLHAAIGRTTRLPRLLNLYGGISNTDLDEERNLVIEVGARQSWHDDRVITEVAWFRNDVKDKIDFVRLPGPGRRGQDQNIEEITAMGVETSISVAVTDSLQMSWDYTYTNIDVDTPTDPNFNRWFHQVNGRIQYNAPWGLGAGLQLSYIDGIPDAFPSNFPDDESQVNFVLLNGKISYEIWKGWRPFLAIENLTDSNYVRNIGYPEPGRRFFFGINAKFESLDIFG